MTTPVTFQELCPITARTPLPQADTSIVRFEHIPSIHFANVWNSTDVLTLTQPALPQDGLDLKKAGTPVCKWRIGAGMKRSSAAARNDETVFPTCNFYLNFGCLCENPQGISKCRAPRAKHLGQNSSPFERVGNFLHGSRRS